MIDGPETADAVAGEILKTPIRRASRTSISGAIYFAMPLFDENPYHGLRRVIDISGDGPNNNGAPVIGGPGSFVVTIKDREKFKEAIRTKLLLEVAGRTPERPVLPAATQNREPRVSCLIGEKIWQDRWGR